MVVRIALILALLVQPAWVLGATPCAAAAEAVLCGCCGPAAEACGCEASPAPPAPAEPEPQAPPTGSAERLVSGILPPQVGTMMAVGASRWPASLGTPEVRPAREGVSAQSLFCVWRT